GGYGGPAALAREQPPREPDDRADLALVAVAIHLLDVLAVADAAGPHEVEVALAEATLPKVEIGHADPGDARPRVEALERLLGDEPERIVAIERQARADEARDLLR